MRADASRAPESLGFIGTMKEHAPAAWPLSMTAIAYATGQPLEAMRAFLDSASGRHFADDVLNRLRLGLPLADAIRAAVHAWMTWRIDARTERRRGIPRGLPYLTGFVIDAEIGEEAAGWCDTDHTLL
ncbi:hypothetical protein OOT46_22825 [Aquabacterium sp. A7-Y]|uniref:hypothetical protein n=1 Tax=Aquabacterium sp. A7-Y TaxID=1349605 RepID=UPI00223C8E9B|nr:hypothetical protein [Aquabacterium sp. A7-Y]MCW7540657.1 hypothetical protein [Aquabacterium sp. A7-Y]